MRYLRQGTAATVEVGPFVDKADGLTAKTALSSQTGRLLKNGTGAAFTGSSWAHDWNGHYLVGFSTSHTDTSGRLRLCFYDVATYLSVWEDFMVLPQQVYDSLVLGSDLLQADATQIEGADATNQLSAALQAAVVEGTITFQQAQRLQLAVLAGKSNGGGTATLHFRDSADGKNRITATVDASGNRTAISLDVS